MGLSIDMFFTEINAVLNEVVIKYGMSLLSEISTVVYYGVFLSIMIKLTHVMVVKREFDIDGMTESLWRVIVFGFIFFSANSFYYKEFIDIASNLGDDLSNKIVGHSGVTGALNKLIDIFLTISKQISEDIQSVGILDALDTIVMSLIIGITGILAFIPLVIAGCVGFLGVKFAITILLIVAPLFCAAGLFDNTRQFFNNWFGLVCNTITLTLIFNIVFGIEMLIIERLIEKHDIIQDLFSWIIACVILCSFTYFLRYVPEISSSLTSGSMGMARSTFGLSPAANKGKQFLADRKAAKEEKLQQKRNQMIGDNIKVG